MNTRTQVTMHPEMQRRAQAKAAQLGISFAEYVRRLVAEDLSEQRPKADISAVFDVIDEGPPTDIARDKDAMIAEALRTEHERETRRKLRPSALRKERAG